MKLIAMLRNPIDAVAALHTTMLACGVETERHLMSAWRLCDHRRKGTNLPPRIADTMSLDYDRIYQYAARLKCMWDVFPREQTHVILFDDFCESTRQVYADVLVFLGVDDDGRMHFDPVNERSRARSQLMANVMGRPPRILKRTAALVRGALGVRSLGFYKLDRLYNRIQTQRVTLAPEQRAEIRRAFADDIAELERLLGRDLSHWR